jgi:hypothetical protein
MRKCNIINFKKYRYDLIQSNSGVRRIIDTEKIYFSNWQAKDLCKFIIEKAEAILECNTEDAVIF